MEELNGEDKVAQILRRNGNKVEYTPKWFPFDLLMNDKIRIEVKFSNIHRDNRWGFTINGFYRKEVDVDCYVFVFAGVPGAKGNLYAMFDAPLKKQGVSFSAKTLMSGGISDAVKRFREFAKKGCL